MGIGEKQSMFNAKRNRSRRSERENIFDKSRNTPDPKRFAESKSSKKMAKPPSSTGQTMYDLSDTIVAPGKDTGAIPKPRRNLDGDLAHSIKSVVDKSVESMRGSIETSMKGAVRRSVQDELVPVNKAIADLSSLVKCLLDNNPEVGRDNMNGQLLQARNETRHVPPPLQQSGSNVLPSNFEYNFPPPSYNLAAQNNTQPPINPPTNLHSDQPVLQSNPPNLQYDQPPRFEQIFRSEKIRVERFGLRFDGNSNNLSVDDFIFRLEYLQAQYNMLWSEIIRDFHLLVTGPAGNWYWLWLNNNRTANWPELRHALLQQYKAPQSNFDIMHDLVDRKQLPGESIDTFFHHLNLLRSKLDHAVTEYDMIKIAKRNVKDSVGRIVYPINVSSVDQLRIECLEAERHFLRKENKGTIQPTPRFTRQIHEAVLEVNDADEEELQAEVEAIGDLICWNCREPGHMFMDCPVVERKLFCYRCGRPNVITPKCPKCQSGNIKRSVIFKGESRSNNNPAK